MFFHALRSLVVAKSVGLQDVDLFCPNFLGHSALDPPVSKMLSAEQSAPRLESHFHLAAFPVGFACRWSAALGIDCGWFHLISDPATRQRVGAAYVLRAKDQQEHKTAVLLEGAALGVHQVDFFLSVKLQNGYADLKMSPEPAKSGE